VAVAGDYYHSLDLRPSPCETAVEEFVPRNVPGTAMLSIFSLAPNPFNPFMEVSFETLGLGHVSMEVYDVSGRHVGTVPLGFFELGQHRARWDGRDASGDNVISGVYFVRLRSSDGKSRVVKAVLLR
jgi:hypothetical protein